MPVSRPQVPGLSSAALAQALDAIAPEAGHGLSPRDPWWLLVAAILARDSTPERANQVQAVLAEHLSGPAGVASMHPRDLERCLIRVPQARQKTRALIEAGRAIATSHRGIVPDDPEILATVPGLDPWTVAVLASEIGGRPSVPVDGHGLRLLIRIGWQESGHGLTAAADRLAHAYAPSVWTRRGFQLTVFGRMICRRGIPRCATCPLVGRCPSCVIAGQQVAPPRR